MEHGEKNTLNAVSGQFTTLDNQPYVGPYHLMDSGIPMTGIHHTSNSVALIPVKPKKSVIAPTAAPLPNTLLNENETEYDLLPTVINKPPVIIRSITEASSPQIKPYSAANASGDFMYIFPDGSVKVHKNTRIVLRVEAQQPDTFNVENGILVIKPSDAELVYQWYFNGELIGSAPGREIDRNELVITNTTPFLAGNYTCTVSNDIGTTDGGSIELEVFNSNVDSLFYSNLIENGDGSDGTTGWNSINDGLVSREINNSIDGEVLKSIIVDPMNQTFTWTREMLYPAPYNLVYGPVRPPSNPANAILIGSENRFDITNYFSRADYTYTVNGGLGVVKAYQDIDLSDALEPHIKGAIYGISGLRGVFCAYLGNAIFNYEPTNEFVLPSERNRPSSYYLGAPRLSVENFSKAGPGFVAEKIYITVEEFENNQPIKSRIITRNGNQDVISTGVLTIMDPWSKRLPKYNNRVYYPGGFGYAVPDEPSLGDSRDAHLFVADEITPQYEDRFTYGQYGELTKAIIERLNPRTNKIRITLTIEAPELGIVLRERGDDRLPTNTGKLWQYLPWQSTWPSRSFGSRNDDAYPNPKNAYNRVLTEYRTDTADLEQRLPKIGESRAFASGMLFTLVPIYSGSRLGETEFDVSDILSQNDSGVSLVESPIDKDLSKYNAAATGIRELKVLFDMDNTKAELRVVVKEKDVDTGTEYLLSYESGLFPFSDSSVQTGLKTQTFVAKPNDGSQLRTYVGTSNTTTNGILIPLYAVQSANKIVFDAIDEEQYNDNDTVTYKRKGSETTLTEDSPRTRLIANTKSDGKSIVQLALTPRPIEAPSEPAWSFGGFDSIDNSFAPILPYQWYAVEERDRIELLISGSTQTPYNRFAVPNQPLNLEEWTAKWQESLVGAIAPVKLTKKPLEAEETPWSGNSRFVITVGVYDPLLLTQTNPSASLISYQNYYLDFVEGGTIIHQTPNLGGVSRLYNFNENEQYINDQITFLNKNNGSYESYMNSEYKTYLDDSEFSVSAGIDPTFIPEFTLQGTTTTIQIPPSILTAPQEAGGLGLPFNQNGEPDLVNYRVALFGIRPATNGYAINPDTKEVDSSKTATTPYTGQNTDFDYKYTLRQIEVTNTFA